MEGNPRLLTGRTYCSDGNPVDETDWVKISSESVNYLKRYLQE